MRTYQLYQGKPVWDKGATFSYSLLVRGDVTPETGRAYETKSLEDMAKALVRDEGFILNSDDGDKITTIDSPVIFKDYLRTPATDSELINFYDLFNNYSQKKAVA